jgi:hypothetical protein
VYVRCTVLHRRDVTLYVSAVIIKSPILRHVHSETPAAVIPVVAIRAAENAHALLNQTDKRGGKV